MEPNKPKTTDTRPQRMASIVAAHRDSHIKRTEDPFIKLVSINPVKQLEWINTARKTPKLDYNNTAIIETGNTKIMIYDYFNIEGKSNEEIKESTERKLLKDNKKAEKKVQSETKMQDETKKRGGRPIKRKTLDWKYRDIDHSAKLLLSFCMVKLTEQNGYKDTKNLNNIITAPLIDYAIAIGRPTSPVQLRKLAVEVRHSISTFFHTTISWTDGDKTPHTFHICGSEEGVKDGIISFAFDRPLALKIIKGGLTSRFNMDALLIKGADDDAYSLTTKLYLHGSMYSNVIRKTNDIISVKSLLAVTSIPTYEEVKAKDRSYNKRIIQPFISALNKVPGLQWEFVSKDLEEYGKQCADYDTFIQLYVSFYFEDMPDLRAEALEYADRRTKQIETARKNKEKAIAQIEAQLQESKLLESKLQESENQNKLCP